MGCPHRWVPEGAGWRCNLCGDHPLSVDMPFMPEIIRQQNMGEQEKEKMRKERNDPKRLAKAHKETIKKIKKLPRNEWYKHIEGLLTMVAIDESRCYFQGVERTNSLDVKEIHKIMDDLGIRKEYEAYLEGKREITTREQRAKKLRKKSFWERLFKL